MNKVTLIGRLTADVRCKEVSGNTKANFTLAVGGYKDHTDFIPIVAWNKTADLAAKYLRKGDRTAIVGRISTRNYEDDEGNNKTIIEVNADEIEFLTTKSERSDENKAKAEEMRSEMEKSDDEDLPF